MKPNQALSSELCSPRWAHLPTAEEYKMECNLSAHSSETWGITVIFVNSGNHKSG